LIVLINLILFSIMVRIAEYREKNELYYILLLPLKHNIFELPILGRGKKIINKFKREKKISKTVR